MKKIQIGETYDDMFDFGGAEGVFDLPYQYQCYYPMFKVILKQLRKKNISNILEVGCGTGAFAHYLICENPVIQYKGFDFSKVAIEKAIKRTGSKELFYYGDATNAHSYNDGYDAIVCTEVLEHVEDDLLVIKNWKQNAYCFCSVPNFDSDYHVRFFTSKEDVYKRYKELIDIENIFVIKKPYLSNISLENTMKLIRWNRYRPKQLIKILGFGDINDVGCWFVLCGKIK